MDPSEKTSSILKNVGALLVKKKESILGSKQSIYYAYKHLYLNAKEHEERVFQCIQSVNV